MTQSNVRGSDLQPQTRFFYAVPHNAVTSLDDELFLLYNYRVPQLYIEKLNFNQQVILKVIHWMSGRLQSMRFGEVRENE